MNKKPLNSSMIFIGLGLLFILTICTRTISTPLIWSHLAQGRSNEPISFLETTNTINTTVLYDKLTYEIYSTGGAPLLIVINTLCVLAAFILLLFVSKKWGGALSQVFSLLIVGHLLFQGFDVSPQSFMMLFVALFIWALTFIKKIIPLFALLIITQIIWTNIHGSFLFGPFIVLLKCIETMQSSKGPVRKREKSIDVTQYGILVAVLLIATLINPYQLHLHIKVLKNLFTPYQTYWASLYNHFYKPTHRDSLIVFCLVLGASGLVTLKKRLPVMLTSLAIIGALFVVGRVHTIQLFSVLAFPFLVLSFTAVGEALSNSLKQLLDKKAYILTPITISILLLLVIISIAPIVTNCAYSQIGSASRFGFGIEERIFPQKAAALLTRPDFPKKALNMSSDGGYLAWKYNRKIFIDYRPGVYPIETIENFRMMFYPGKEANQAYDKIFDQYRPEAIIINCLSSAAANGGLAKFLSTPRWKLAYFDGITAILLLNKKELAPLMNDSTIQQGLTYLEQDKALFKQQMGKLCNTANPAALIGAGSVYLSLSRLKESLDIFQRLIDANDQSPGAWIGKGKSELMLRKFKESTTSLKKAISLAPNNFAAWSSYAVACDYDGNKEEAKKAFDHAKRIQEKLYRKKKEEKKEETKIDDVDKVDPALPDLAVPKKL